MTNRHWDLKEVERATLAAWCRLASFTAPETLLETVDIYRGTIGCSPAEAATGLHWSLSFNDAAWFACRFADAALRGVIVLHARVPLTGIAAYIPDTAHQEAVLAELPAAFEVVTNAELIGDAAVRNHHLLDTLRSQGWVSVASFERTHQAAMAARARMVAKRY